MNKKKGTGRGVGLYIIAFVVLLVTLSLLLGPGETAAPVSYTEIRSDIKAGNVTALVIGSNEISVQLKDGTEYLYEVTDMDYFMSDLGDDLSRQQDNGTLTVDYYVQNTSILMSFLPYIVIIVLLGAFWAFMLNRQAGGGGGGGAMSFGKSRARMTTPGDQQRRVTFKDVAGADEEKADLEEIVDFLRDPKKYMALGARIPKGVLLVGPPGTGKTLIAKAVAGEAGVPFFSISGSDFVELYVGVGASRVRDLFSEAKKHAPAIVFIDEIDAVGRQRGAGLGGGHDEREQTLNQLLVEMDGFSANEGVIVIAATNRKDILDPALLRPGRFDRQIYVGAPDWRGREEILKVHARKKPLGDNVDLAALAKATAGFTGADLANLLNEGALLAARRGAAFIGQQDLETAMIKVIAGPEKKSRIVSHAEKMLTAVHEAGHAICMYCLDSQDPVHLITIIPRAQAGGMTISLPQDDKSYASRNEMFETIVSFLGGRVAESLKLCDISTGASNDLQRATGIARDMIAKYGMSDAIGPVSFASSREVFIGRDYEKTKSYSERTAGEIDAQVQAIMREAYKRCEEILRAHSERLDKIAGFLMENENMDRTQFEAVMQDETLDQTEA